MLLRENNAYLYFAEVLSRRIVTSSMVCPLMRQRYSLDVFELQTTLLRDVKYGFHIYVDCIQAVLCVMSHN